MERKACTARSDLEQMLVDETAEPKALPLSLLEDITDDFSNDREIGSGGFAVVYKGILGDRSVAVKKLSKAYMHETEFHREVECLMRVKHKNVVRFLGYCADRQGSMAKYNGKFVMADVHQRLLCFEYIRKGSLDKYIIDAYREWRTCYKIIKGICVGLQFLHENHIIHLDLKPANILLDDSMVPKITDFGLSRCFDEKQSRDITKTILGTRGYLAPEFWQEGVIARSADLYSLGVIIIEILTGQKGYQATEDVLESWSDRLERSQRDTLSKQIRVCYEIALKCRDSNPNKRPASAQDIIDRLHETESMQVCCEPLRTTGLMEYALLRDVNDSSQDRRIRVRVCWIWEHPDAIRDAEVLRLHMVLGDEKGDGIHAIIPKGLIAKFQKLIAEGNVYYLQYFETFPVMEQYRTTPHRFELRFTARTTIRRIDPVPDGFPFYVYRLRSSLKDIANTVTDKTYLADVVALVNGVSEITEVSVKGKPTAKRNLRVTDGSQMAIVVLWGSNAEEVDANDLIRRSLREPVIMLAMGCSFKIQDGFGGMLMLAGGYGSKLSINLANPDVSAFRDKITGIPHSIELLAERGTSAAGTSAVSGVSATVVGEETGAAHGADLDVATPVKDVLECGQKGLENLAEEGGYEGLEKNPTEGACGGVENLATEGVGGGDEKASSEVGRGGANNPATDVATRVERPTGKRTRHDGGKGNTSKRLFAEEHAAESQGAGQK